MGLFGLLISSLGPVLPDLSNQVSVPLDVLGYPGLGECSYPGYPTNSSHDSNLMPWKALY